MFVDYSHVFLVQVPSFIETYDVADDIFGTEYLGLLVVGLPALIIVKGCGEYFSA